ncbi:MAG: response regulator, partial [Anaerolineales bacterium]|nr:response regulator [Anaerolineales bacterium]
MEELNVTILLVEDDLSMLDGIKDLLEMAPLEAEDMLYHVSVITAYDGFQGLTQAREHSPELIISDIMMPKMTGHEFLHELRQNPDWLQIPFIFLTAKGEKSDYEEGRLKGADLYITKPFDSDAFLEQIKTQLHRSLKLKALQQQHIEDLKKHILQILYHEFRTPLTYVTAYYEMLEDGVDRPAEVVREYLRGIQAGCIRLTR